MRYNFAMDSRSTSVRIDELTRDRLKHLSEKSGVSITKLITLATAYYVEQVEKSGMINVPLKHGQNIVAQQAVMNGAIINHNNLHVNESSSTYGKRKRSKGK